MGSAYTEFQEKEIGSIEKGKITDMAIWDSDFYTISQDEMRDVNPEVTIVGGKTVYKGAVHEIWSIRWITRKAGCLKKPAQCRDG